MVWAALIGAACLVGPARVGGAGPLLGVNLDLTGLSGEQRDARLKALAEAGVTSVRMPLDWNRVEPEPGRYQWEVYEEAVEAAQGAGLEVVFVLGPCAEWAVNPAWQVPAQERARSVPQSMEVWERYVARAVSRFGDRVKFWQVRRQPTARNFRGARAEYLRLLERAARTVRKTDAGGRVIVPEGGTLDVAAADRLLHTAAAEWCDVVGVYLPREPSRAMLPWAVLSGEVLGEAGTEERRPVWVLGGAESLAPEAWMAYYLLAWAFGAERCYVPATAVEGAWVRALAELQYVGFVLPRPGVVALVFQAAEGHAVIAWAWDAVEMPARELCPVVDAEAVREATVLGGPAGSAAEGEGEAVRLRLGPRPALIRGLNPEGVVTAGAPSREAVLAARPGPDLSGVPAVYADYSLAERPEVGLYNRELRGMRGGAVVEEQHGGTRCVRTAISFRRGEKDNPWIFFDVDDSWLYFAREGTRVTVTVVCEGSYRGEKMLGFNILYDARSGYRFAKWQWVDAGYGWRRYRVVLEDVSFANRDGYDFRINAKGSKQDLWVSAVVVERLPAEREARSAR